MIVAAMDGSELFVIVGFEVIQPMDCVNSTEIAVNTNRWTARREMFAAIDDR